MSADGQITDRSRSLGNAVPHSKRCSRRTCKPNIEVKTYYLPSEDRHITLRVSSKGVKIIDRDGIETVVALLRRQRVKI
jgi:large subunit ribosomal protein L28